MSPKPLYGVLAVPGLAVPSNLISGFLMENGLDFPLMIAPLFATGSCTFFAGGRGLT
jgi:hypothetical protein